jgi:hypothetical protein
MISVMWYQLYDISFQCSLDVYLNMEWFPIIAQAVHSVARHGEVYSICHKIHQCIEKNRSFISRKYLNFAVYLPDTPAVPVVPWSPSAPARRFLTLKKCLLNKI